MKSVLMVLLACLFSFSGNLYCQDILAVTAEIKLAPEKRTGIIYIHSKVADGWKIYSISQQAGGPKKTTFKFPESTDFKLGKFESQKKPVVEKSADFDVPLETHKSSVTWSAPIEIAEGVDVGKLKLDFLYSGIACEAKPNGACRLFPKLAVSAKFGGYDKSLVKTETGTNAQPKEIKLTPYKPRMSHVELTGRLFHPTGKPIQAGNKVKLELTANTSGEFHVYDHQNASQNVDYMATRIGFVTTKTGR